MDENFLKSWPEFFVPSAVFRQGVTVSSLGPAFNGFLPISDTFYSYPYSVAKGFSLALASLVKRGGGRVDLDYVPAFVHSQWSRGYYHWMTESLPRAVNAVEQFPDCMILIPKSYDAFHKESLDLLGIKSSYFPEHNVKVEKCVVTTCPSHYGTTNSASLINVRNKLVERAASGVSFGRRIYISRKKARGRKVVNEREVVDLLGKFGFEEVVPEDFSFEDQVSIFSQAEFLVGIHGAGLTNMLFMSEGASVVELLPYRNGVFDFRPNSLSCKHDNCYINLAKSLGVRYDYLQCGHDKSRFKKTHMANLHVDCSELSALLARIFPEVV